MLISNLNFKFTVFGFVLIAFLVTGCAQINSDEPHTSEHDRIHQQVNNFLRDIFTSFENENIRGVMKLVAEDFHRDRSTFESDVDTNISGHNTIFYEYFVDRVIHGKKHIEVKFHWDRRWRDANTGAETLTEGETTFRLIEEDGSIQLQDLRGDNPFTP